MDFKINIDTVRYNVDGMCIYKERVAAGLTISEVAQRVGYSAAMHCYIENNVLSRGVCRRYALKLCEVFPNLTMEQTNVSIND